MYIKVQKYPYMIHVLMKGILGMPEEENQMMCVTFFTIKNCIANILISIQTAHNKLKQHSAAANISQVYVKTNLPSQKTSQDSLNYRCQPS